MSEYQRIGDELARKIEQVKRLHELSNNDNQRDYLSLMREELEYELVMHIDMAFGDDE